MNKIVLIKETSERSDKDNWVKNALLSYTDFSLESMEGCSQNAQNQVTHLMERALCNDLPNPFNLKDVHEAIIALEGKESLDRKIAFCGAFNLPFYYVVYGNAPHEFVKLCALKEELSLIQAFNSYKEFSFWIKSIKGWHSSSSFLHYEELPFFDKELRKYTAWPTNIDCFISSKNDEPKAILEFQNAHKNPIKSHENNNYFWGLTQKDDQRRWFSQEILRVQSGLPFIIITWSKIHQGFILKKLEKVVFPNFANVELKNLLRAFVQKRVNGKGNRTPRQLYDEICNGYETEELYLENGVVKTKINKPPLSYENKTFPMMYFSHSHKEETNHANLIEVFNSVIL